MDVLKSIVSFVSPLMTLIWKLSPYECTLSVYIPHLKKIETDDVASDEGTGEGTFR